MRSIYRWFKFRKLKRQLTAHRRACRSLETELGGRDLSIYEEAALTRRLQEALAELRATQASLEMLEEEQGR